MKIYCQEGFEAAKAYPVFLQDANKIDNAIQDNKQKISFWNQKGVSSRKIQDFLYELIIKELKYSYEEKEDFFRADFMKKGDNYGIMIEVERGKTINNNMDFIDFWKCHINPTTNMLILIVPEEVPRADNKKPKIYPFVIKRMEPLFRKENYTNVKALAVIPY